MRRPVSHFADLGTIAAATGLRARGFVPFAPDGNAEFLADLEPGTALATVYDTAGRTLTITAAMLLDHITATVAENARPFASWLVVAHLSGLASDAEYLWH